MMARRILGFIPLLFGITLLSFFIMHLAPGDPTMMFVDPSVQIQDMAQVKQNLGLDKPLYVQYFFWLKEVLKGNLGFSYISGRPVLGLILERLPATLLLSVSSLFFILLFTFPLGLLSGYKKDSFFDRAVTFLSFLGMSLPAFWLGLMLILLFSLRWSLFPTFGFMDPMLDAASLWTRALSIMRHMFLPLLTILIGGLAGLIRFNRFSIIEILSQDYIQAGRARGLSEKRLLFKHAFKNAALPIVTILGAGLSGLIGGSFVIEFIFSWPGMGQLGVEAVFARDYPVLMGSILFSSLLIVLGNFLADVSYSKIDPRVRIR
jgi:peptide/nickel transport system permease protein